MKPFHEVPPGQTQLVPFQIWLDWQVVIEGAHAYPFHTVPAGHLQQLVAGSQTCPLEQV